MIRGGGAVACGPGADTVIGGGASAGVLAPDCESIDDTFGLVMDPHPVQSGRRSVRFPMWCAIEDSETEERASCTATIDLRETSGRHRLLGHADVGRDVWDGQLTTVRLTKLGTRLRSRRALVAGVTIRIHNDLTGHPRLVDQVLRWAIRLSRRR